MVDLFLVLNSILIYIVTRPVFAPSRSLWKFPLSTTSSSCIVCFCNDSSPDSRKIQSQSIFICIVFPVYSDFNGNALRLYISSIMLNIGFPFIALLFWQCTSVPGFYRAFFYHDECFLLSVEIIKRPGIY